MSSMRLLLLRHAKSDWGNPDLEDFDRPLNARGQSAARIMSVFLCEHGLIPKKILCSTSLRTRETLARLLPDLNNEADIHLISDIYDHNETDYLNLIQAHGGGAQTLMVIGHNPATELTALELTGTGDPDLVADMDFKFPTAALAVIDFDIVDWSEVRGGTGHLHMFAKPRDLGPVGI